MAEIIGVVSFVVIALLLSSFKVVKDYERLIVFQLGHVKGLRGPGLQFVAPFLEHFVKLDLRSSSIPLHMHELVTRDDIIIEIKANCLFEIGDALKLVGNLEDPKFTTESVVKSALSNAIKQNDLEHLLQAQSEFLKRLCSSIDKQTAKLGIRVTLIQLEDIKIIRGRVAGNGHVSGNGEALTEHSLHIENVGTDGNNTVDEMQLVTDILEDDSSKVDELELVPAAYLSGPHDYEYGSHSYVYGHNHKNTVDN